MPNKIILSSKVPKCFKELLENISCLRRGEINGKSIDKKRLNNIQIMILIKKWLGTDRESFLKLLNFEYNETTERKKNG